MHEIHRFLWNVTVALLGGGIAWSLLLVLRGQTGGDPFERYQAAVVALLAVAAASGLLLLAGGSGPRDPLHLLYGLVALGLIPLARSFGGRLEARRRSAPLLLGLLALAGVLYRLLTTGG